MAKYRKDEKHDFNFVHLSYGRHLVQYISPTTGLVWTRETDDMLMIDSVKNKEQPRRKDMTYLKKFIKRKI